MHQQIFFLYYTFIFPHGENGFKLIMQKFDKLGGLAVEVPFVSPCFYTV